MMKEIFEYTDRVVSMVRPRKLLMMAIDGVAPRAKMNQQRSRRFRAAQEAEDKEKDRQNAIKEWEAMGKDLTEEFKGEKAWDSNAITPGTPFMDKLAKSLRYWVRKKLNEDPGWAGVSSFLSLTLPSILRETDSILHPVLCRAVGDYHFGCISTRRRRTQNYGFYSTSTSSPFPQSKYETCHLWTRCGFDHVEFGDS